MYIMRWNFGMEETGTNRHIGRMVLVSGTRAIYTLDSTVRTFPYGLSGIGVLIWNGQAMNAMRNGVDDDGDGRADEDGPERTREGRVIDSEQQDNDRDGRFNEDDDWPYWNRDRQRTAIAWDDRGHFYLIVFEGSDTSGVTWQETVNFFREELPRWMRDDLPNFVANEPAYEGARISSQRITIHDAIMLDGGSSTQFIWRWAQRRRRSDGSWVEPIQQLYEGEGRSVPTLVEASAVAP